MGHKFVVSMESALGGDSDAREALEDIESALRHKGVEVEVSASGKTITIEVKGREHDVALSDDAKNLEFLDLISEAVEAADVEWDDIDQEYVNA